MHAHDTADEVWLGVPVVVRIGELGEKPGMTHAMGGRVTDGCGAVTGRFTRGSSQVLPDRFVEGYKTRAFDRRKTEGTENRFFSSLKKNNC